LEKINLGIIFGGRSTEHEISVRSARSLIKAINPSKYNISLIGIDKSGQWFLHDTSKFIAAENQQSAAADNIHSLEISMVKRDEFTGAVSTKTNLPLQSLDVVFPVLHGAFGEDGTIQGLFRMIDIPFVGVDLLASAVGMDKDVTKRLLRDAGISVADFVCIRKSSLSNELFGQVTEKLGLPLFIKPANAGSSVGVSKVTDPKGFEEALKLAFEFDNKVLIEEAIIGKEVECAILGNENPKASVVGEIVPRTSFYSYESKYINDSGADLRIPAEIDPEIADKIRSTAIRAFQLIEGEGLSRVDFFLKKDNTFVLNEINTMPGFTSISMYPKLWEASGLSYSDLIDELITLAIARHHRNRKLKTSI